MSRLADLACRAGRMLFEGFEAMGRSYLPVTPPPPVPFPSETPWPVPGAAAAHPDFERRTVLSRRERRAWRRLAAGLATATTEPLESGGRPELHPGKDSA